MLEIICKLEFGANVTDESIEAYMSRWNTDYAVTVMQFMDGAKAYFAN